MAHKLRQTHVKLKISGAYFGSSNPEFDASLTEVLTQINLALTTARCTAKTKNEQHKDDNVLEQHLLHCMRERSS